MSAVRTATTLVAGVAIGLVSGHVLRGLAAGESAAPPPRPLEVAAGTTEGRIERLETELAHERVARLKAEASRDAAVERATAVPEVAAAQPSLAAAPAPAVPREPASREALDPVACAARAKDLEPEVARVLETHDGARAVALLGDLSKLGRAGWPLAVKIATALETSLEQGKHLFGVGAREFFKAASAGDFPDLFADALANPQGYDPAYRRLAASRLPWTDHEGTDELCFSQIATETDPAVADELLSAVSGRRDATATAALLTAFRAQSHPEIRGSILGWLEEIPGDDAARALATIASSESDPELRKTAELSLASRQAPVTGFFVTEVAKGSQAEAAGVQLGDILTAYNGIALRSWDDLAKAKQGAPRGTTVVVQLYRGGQPLELPMRGGQMGINGRFVQPPT